MAKQDALQPAKARTSRPKPNNQASPGSIGNTPGLIAPKPSPNGGIQAGKPTALTDPDVAAETPQELGILDRAQELYETTAAKAGELYEGSKLQRWVDAAGKIYARGNIKVLEKAQQYALDKIDAAVAAGGYSWPAIVAGAIGQTAVTVLMPTNVADLVPVGKVASGAKKAISAGKKAVTAGKKAGTAVGLLQKAEKGVGAAGGARRATGGVKAAGDVPMAGRATVKKTLNETAARSGAGRPTPGSRGRRAADAEQPGGGGKRNDGGNFRGRTRKMEPHEVPCFKKGKSNNSSDHEYDRQLKDQEEALNDMTVDEYLKARAAYRRRGRGKKAALETKRFRDEFQKNKANKLSASKVKSGMAKGQARRQAKREAKALVDGLDALHSPDLNVGGDAMPHRMGDPSANRSIGSQWPQRKRVKDLDKAARRARGTMGKMAGMNVRLKRCK